MWRWTPSDTTFTLGILVGLLCGLVLVFLQSRAYETSNISVSNLGNCTYIVSSIGIVRHLNCDYVDSEVPEFPTPLINSNL
jgi:hypothetical protein